MPLVHGPDSDVLACVLLAASPFYTFVGARLFRPTVAAVAFAAGGYGALYLLCRASSQACEQHTVRVPVVVACGAVAASVVHSLFGAAVFTAGAVGGAVAVQAAARAAEGAGAGDLSGGPAWAHPAALGAGALAGAGVSFWVLERVARVLTAFVGAYMAVAGADHWAWRAGEVREPTLAPGRFFAAHERLECHSGWCRALVALWGLLFVAGVAAQFGRKRSAANPRRQYAGARRRRPSQRPLLER